MLGIRLGLGAEVLGSQPSLPVIDELAAGVDAGRWDGRAFVELSALGAVIGGLIITNPQPEIADQRLRPG